MAHVGSISGLQAHSLGEFYPWRVVSRGDGRKQWYNGDTGELAGPWTIGELSNTPPVSTAGDWVVRFYLPNTPKGYRAAAYNVATFEHRSIHVGQDYNVVLSAAAADIPAIAQAPTLQDSPALAEFRFLVPITRPDGTPHDYLDSRWLGNTLIREFGGFTHGGTVEGAWNDASGSLVNDKSEVYIVAVEPTKIGRLQLIIREACKRFQQDCIYVVQSGVARLLVS